VNLLPERVLHVVGRIYAHPAGGAVVLL